MDESYPVDDLQQQAIKSWEEQANRLGILSDHTSKTTTKTKNKPS